MNRFKLLATLVSILLSITGYVSASSGSLGFFVSSNTIGSGCGELGYSCNPAAQFSWGQAESSPNTWGVTKVTSGTELTWSGISVDYNNQNDPGAILNYLSEYGGITESQEFQLPGTPNFAIRGSITAVVHVGKGIYHSVTCNNIVLAQFSVDDNGNHSYPWVLAQDNSDGQSTFIATNDGANAGANITCSDNTNSNVYTVPVGAGGTYGTFNFYAATLQSEASN
jgi:hypothetical protein